MLGRNVVAILVLIDSGEMVLAIALTWVLLFSTLFVGL